MKSKKSRLGIRLGENIADRRKELGLTQADLAEKLGTDAVTISRFERGTNLPSLLRCEQLAEAMDFSLAKLLSSSSTLASDQILTIQELITGLNDKDREFLMDSLKNWTKYLKSNAKLKSY